jgi:peptidoglycan/xylan/chitin deacetylase (PgdA/CDA1 family)
VPSRSTRQPVVLLLAALLLSSLIAPLAMAQERQGQAEPEPEVGIVVSTTDLNIRDCPRSDCAVLDSVPLNGTLDVLGPPEDGYIPVATANAQGWAFALFVASAYTGTPSLTEGMPGCKRVALIFNVGKGDWNDPMSWDIVNYMIDNQVKATMFIRGWWAAYYPAWVQEFDRAGFVIGTHGEDGLELDDRTTESVMVEIANATSEIDTALGHASDPIFSPASPEGDPRIHSMIAFAGFLPVLWKVEAGDGHDSDASAEEVRENVLDNVYDGAIIELHLDTPTAISATTPALPGIVSSLRADGYQLVTIPEMAQPCG